MSKPKKKGLRKSSRDQNLRSLYRSYQYSAKRRKYAFALSLEQFEKITQEHCYICGRPPSAKHFHEKKPYLRFPYVYTGIDRVTNANGYLIGNVLPCCTTCNRAKGQMDLEEFLTYLYEAYHYSIAPSPSPTQEKEPTNGLPDPDSETSAED